MKLPAAISNSGPIIPLLVPPQYVSPGSAKIPALDTLTAQLFGSPSPFRGGVLCPPFWGITPNGLPSGNRFSGQPEFEGSQIPLYLTHADDELALGDWYYGYWYYAGPAWVTPMAVVGGVPGNTWENYPGPYPGGYPNRPPPTGGPWPTWRMLAMSNPSDDFSLVGSLAPRTYQLVIAMQLVLPGFGIGTVGWGIESSLPDGAPWPDCMSPDGVTLPVVGQNMPVTTGYDWTGSTVAIAWIHKPAWPYPGHI